MYTKTFDLHCNNSERVSGQFGVDWAQTLSENSTSEKRRGKNKVALAVELTVVKTSPYITTIVIKTYKYSKHTKMASSVLLKHIFH